MQQEENSNFDRSRVTKDQLLEWCSRKTVTIGARRVMQPIDDSSEIQDTVTEEYVGDLIPPSIGYDINRWLQKVEESVHGLTDKEGSPKEGVEYIIPSIEMNIQELSQNVKDVEYKSNKSLPNKEDYRVPDRGRKKTDPWVSVVYGLSTIMV